MALVSKPFTFTNGAVISHSQHNDNFDRLYSLVNGNIDNANLSATAGIALSKLAITPAARVYHNAAQAIADNTTIALALNSERYDTAALHDTATNNSRLTAPLSGIYTVFACVEWASSGTGTRQLTIRKNGTTFLLARRDAAISGAVQQVVAGQVQLAASDYLEVVVAQTSGGALNVNSTSDFSPEFGMSFVSHAS